MTVNPTVDGSHVLVQLGKLAVDLVDDHLRRRLENLVFTGGKGSLTQWVHCEFVVSFEAIRPVITQQVCSEFF